MLEISRRATAMTCLTESAINQAEPRLTHERYDAIGRTTIITYLQCFIVHFFQLQMAGFDSNVGITVPFSFVQYISVVRQRYTLDEVLISFNFFVQCKNSK